MRATEVIETYIDDTVRLLPRRQRDDVAAELRTLLNEELRARAQQSGRAPNEALALSLVQGYGHPNEAASRYQPAWTIIDPADSRGFVRAAFMIATFFVFLYGAPTWVLEHVSRGRFDTSWATYTEDFQRLRLPWLIGLMVGLLALLTFVAIHGRWSWLTRRMNIGLNLAMAGLILSLAVDGNIFQSSVVDQIARNVLALVAAIYVPSVGIMLYGEIGRLDRRFS